MPSRRPAAVVLEFLGLPGAGKTAIAERLLASCRARGWVCAGRRDLAPRGLARLFRPVTRLGFAVRHPAAPAATLRFALSIRPRTWQGIRHAMRAARWGAALTDAGRGFDLLVLDQGPLQDLWSAQLGATGWSPAARDAAVRAALAGPARALVYFTIDADRAARRVLDRSPGSSRVDRLPPDEARRLLDRERERIEALFARSRELAATRSLCLDAARPLEDVSAAVESFVLDLARGTRAA